MRLGKQRIFYTKLIASEKVKNWNKKFYKGNPWTFDSPYMMIRFFFIPRSKLNYIDDDK